MNSCKNIRELIDEADKPDLLSFEATEHIGRCDDCARFAIERASLRKLVAGDRRVSAPLNFDAMLNARLAKVKARRPFWRLDMPGYLRLTAAAAGLVVMIFGAQYAGLFSDNTKTTSADLVGSTNPSPTQDAVEPVSPTQPNGIVTRPKGPQLPLISPSSAALAMRPKRGDLAANKVPPPGYLTVEDAGVVLVRGRNGDMDVQVPTVSVGAQPLLYVSAGQRTVRNVGTSF
jgi:hypothetical protein